MKILNLKEVEKKTSICKTTIYKLIKKDEFPVGTKLTEMRVGWLESQIDEWISTKFDNVNNAK